MKSKQLYKLAKQIWFPDIKALGFVEKNGEYFRMLNSGVVHLIGVGKDPNGVETFRIMCGVDAVPLREELGSFGYMKHDGCMHLTAKGWDYNSGRWPCETEVEARASLTALFPLILNLAISWFDPIKTLSDVGDEINEVRKPGLGWMKARLYMLDGDYLRALAAIDTYAAWAAKPRNWGTRECQLEDMARAERIRKEIEEAKRALR